MGVSGGSSGHLRDSMSSKKKKTKKKMKKKKTKKKRKTKTKKRTKKKKRTKTKTKKKIKKKIKKKKLPQQVGEASKGFGSNGGDAVMVDVELFQAGQVPQTEVLQLLNVVLLQVESHQLAQRGETHGAHLKSDEHTVVMTSCPQEAEGTFRRNVSPV